MHLLSHYAHACSCKISEPLVPTNFYPVPSSKYVTLNTFGGMGAKFYNYWGIILNVIGPVLKANGIDIIQLGDGNTEPIYGNVIRLAGQTNFSQSSYIVKNALLHLGTDSSLVHVASTFDIPLVSLYSVSPPSICGPYFSSPGKAICIEPPMDKDEFYSFNPNENPKKIDRILPETIVEAVGKLLNLEFPKFFTLHLGSSFSSHILELIPNSVVGADFFKDNPLNIRYDKGGQEAAIFEQLKHRLCAITTNKPLNIAGLNHFKQHIQEIRYIIDQNEDVEFARQLLTLGVPVQLVSYESDDFIQGVKLKYLEVAPIHKGKKPTKPAKLEEPIKPLVYFTANKRILSNGKFYLSYAHEAKNDPISDFHNGTGLVIDSPDFFEDSEFHHIFTKNS